MVWYVFSIGKNRNLPFIFEKLHIVDVEQHMQLWLAAMSVREYLHLHVSKKELVVGLHTTHGSLIYTINEIITMMFTTHGECNKSQ